MERFCGSLLPAIKSRRHPFANIDRRVQDLAMLKQIQNLYNIDLNLSRRRRQLVAERRDCIDGYKHIELISRHPDFIIPQGPGLRAKLLATLATRYQKPTDVVKQYLPITVKQWGKVLYSGKGDLIVARETIPLHNGFRDNSFIRYEQLVDRLAHRPNARPVLERRVFYGQLLRIFLVTIPASVHLNTTHPDNVLLATIRRCNVTQVDRSLDTPYYNDMGPLDVVDLRAVHSVVGRVQDSRGFWGIIDRSGPLARSEFLGDEPAERDIEEPVT
ncbi:hypothetical protein CTheo_9063 [Ceratobasidium theobromae]|uniref:Uncharacterized protein n=1 Tax=Ceratobasidium theobromae TaxID=1582974 RepID=A0A5N5Q7X7_9AGAM|nr:hypothetical protein CTheo_9063 [Ceratobasidium theobromae]